MPFPPITLRPRRIEVARFLGDDELFRRASTRNAERRFAEAVRALERRLVLSTHAHAR